MLPTHRLNPTAVMTRACLLLLATVLAALAGCGGDGGAGAAGGGGLFGGNLFGGGTPKTTPTPPGSVTVSAARLGPTAIEPRAGAAEVSAAKNEWTSVVVRVAGLPKAEGNKLFRLKLNDLVLAGTGGSAVLPSAMRVYQILPMPVDLYRAGYIRHTGQTSLPPNVPRALLPLTVDQGQINLAAARNPAKPTDPDGRLQPGQPLDLWIDVRVPVETPPGLYVGRVDVLESGNPAPLAGVEVKLTVWDFVLSDERHLQMIGQLSWTDLQKHFIDRFETVAPRLLSRNNPQHKPAVESLDALVKLAQEHRLQVVIPRLQPTVKWPAGKPPELDWTDFDSVVRPWMTGEAFADKVPLGFWPLPKIDYLDNFAEVARQQYWAAAASHFDQFDWLERSPVWVDKLTPGRAGAAERIAMSAEAARVLGAHPRLKVALPLDYDQVEFQNASNPNLIATGAADRVIAASPGLISASPMQQWPVGAKQPTTWLRTDLPGLIPYVGAGGDETDLRTWAWLAFERGSPLIRWGTALPSAAKPTEPADPSELIWFYPGEWFGTSEPLATVQLKWMRRAQQDYEYLYTARQRGEVLSAKLFARLLSKPVEIQPGQEPDATYGMMTGTPDEPTWDEALNFLARLILLRDPGAPPNPGDMNALNLEMIQWMQPRERPSALGRSVEWTPGEPIVQGAPDRWWFMKTAIDVYNAADVTPANNTLEYSALPQGWEVQPQPVVIPSLAVYQVKPFTMVARVDPTKVKTREHVPVEITFTQGFTKQRTPVKLQIPVSQTLRRQTPLRIDGSLGDWTDDDAIQKGPLVRMYDRRSVQRHEPKLADTPTEVYTGWADENLYLAFKVGGVMRPGDVQQTRNFVEKQFRRAWGEDLVQVLMQPVYDDGSLGPVLHVVCKTNGEWAERALDPKANANPFAPFVSNVRYAATVEADTWRGELAIPWDALEDATAAVAVAGNQPGSAGVPVAPGPRRLPVALRFNFSQHKTATGESASWAGPVDFGNDPRFTGLLLIRDPGNPGMPGK